MPKWNAVRTPEFDRDARRYAKKKRSEFAAVMANLDRLLKVLDEVNEVSRVSCGFFSPEGQGLYRIGEHGGGKVEPTRLYVALRIVGTEVHLLSVRPKGSPKKQSEDIRSLQPIAARISSEK